MLCLVHNDSCGKCLAGVGWNFEMTVVYMELLNKRKMLGASSPEASGQGKKRFFQKFRFLLLMVPRGQIQVYGGSHDSNNTYISPSAGCHGIFPGNFPLYICVKCTTSFSPPSWVKKVRLCHIRRKFYYERVHIEVYCGVWG